MDVLAKATATYLVGANADVPETNTALEPVDAVLVENPQTQTDWEAIFGPTTRSAAGPIITPRTAFRVAAFWNAVDLISGDIARLPLNVYRRRDDDSPEVAFKSSVHQALAVQPNPWQSPVEFWCTVMVQLLVYGTAYVAITRRGNGQVSRLLPLFSDRTQTEWVDGEMWVVTELPYDGTFGQLVAYRSHQVLRFHGMVLDNFDHALPLYHYARETLGLALAAQGYASQFFASGGRIGGILEIPAGTSKKARDNIEEGFQKAYQSVAKAFQTVILREGSKFNAGQFSPGDAQLEAARVFEVSEIARFFKLHPSRLGLDLKSSYNSKAADNRDYLDRTLASWMAKIQGECNIKLLGADYRVGRMYCKHDTSELLWMDPVQRAEYFNKLIAARVINPNEARLQLNLPKGPPELDEFVNPNTMSGEGEEGEGETKTEGEITEAALLLQKIYLAVGVILSADEARAMVSQAGYPLPGSLEVVCEDPCADEPVEEAEAPAEEEEPVTANAFVTLLNDRSESTLKAFTDKAKRGASSSHRFIEWLDDRADKDIKAVTNAVDLVCTVYRQTGGRDIRNAARDMIIANTVVRFRRLAEETHADNLKQDTARMASEICDNLPTQLTELLNHGT